MPEARARRGRPALGALLVALAMGGAAPTGAVAPELGWRLLPGDGDGSEDSQAAPVGPISASRSNSLPGVSSDGAASADYGTLSARTQTSVDAAQNSGESFCYPIPPAFSCSEAEAWWSDRLVFAAPGVVANGTPGSFTARLTIDAQLAASKPSSMSWQFVTVESDYLVQVELDGALVESIFVSCIAIPGLGCIPVAVQTHYPSAQVTNPAPSGTFDLGPYDLTWGQPFAFEVRLEANTSMNSESQTSGQASASADLENTLEWSAVLALFDAPAGGGSQVPLASALVDPASGADWLGTVAVPEPRPVPLAVAALSTVAALVGRRRSSRRRWAAA